ncbi:MAG: exonuclease domain-containing protein [Candidatus Binatia bacterium]
MHHPTFAAIDYETADRRPTSACALGLVVVERGEIVQRVKRLINPGESSWTFSPLHGIGPDEVRDAGCFATVWDAVSSSLGAVKFFAAHNAGFDERVLYTCSQAAAPHYSAPLFVCTLRLASNRLRIRPSGLAVVAQRLGIPLVHHDPLSDAEAAARITPAPPRPRGSPVITHLQGHRIEGSPASAGEPGVTTGVTTSVASRPAAGWHNNSACPCSRDQQCSRTREHYQYRELERSVRRSSGDDPCDQA